MSSRMPQRNQLIELFTPVVSAAGYDLEDVTIKDVGRQCQLRVVIDRDGGVILDDVAEISRALSDALDAAQGIMGQPSYVLEVSSPGVKRPLVELRHWRRAAGRLAKVSVTDQGTIEGRIVRVDGETVVLEVAGVEREIAFHTLGPGQIVLEFKRSDADSESAGKSQKFSDQEGETP